MIGRLRRQALEAQAQRAAAGFKRQARRRTPKGVELPALGPSVSSCQNCGALRQAVEGRLPPHKCGAA